MTDRFTVYAPTTISQQQVDDLLCSAFEGGITYWCDNAEVQGEWPEGATYAHETLTRGSRIILHDMEDDDTCSLTLAKFLEGIVKAAAHARQDVHTFLEDHDADSADWAVQYAVFGELVYG